jgi:5-methylcytosine-specific restriction endonuclease McrA
MNLTIMSNEELLSGLQTLVGQGRLVLARLLAHLGEVEERRLDLASACSSLFDFCVRRLGMGEDEACRRVAAARLVRRFPVALGMIERGEIHLTSLLLLREHLTDENHEELLGTATGLTKNEVLHLIAARFPRPDAPCLIRPLPAEPALSPQPTDMRSGGVKVPALPHVSSASRIEPLSTERYKVQFTASAELRQKLERATNLMRHGNPSGDLSVVVERAVDLLLAELEKQRLGKTTRSRRRTLRKGTRRGYVPRAVRREVFERDGEQCTYVDEAGRRCQSRTFLELDHRTPRALGGTDDPANLRIRCRAHNALAAEEDFGRQHIAKRISEKKVDPRQRGYDRETARRALRSLGFKDGQVRRALGILDERWVGAAPPIETVLREALSVLT